MDLFVVLNSLDPCESVGLGNRSGLTHKGNFDSRVSKTNALLVRYLNLLAFLLKSVPRDLPYEEERKTELSAVQAKQSYCKTNSFEREKEDRDQQESGSSYVIWKFRSVDLHNKNKLFNPSVHIDWLACKGNRKSVPVP